MTPPFRDRIAELRRLMAEATPGPVTVGPGADGRDPNYHCLEAGHGFHHERDGGFRMTGFARPADAALLVAARNAIGDLLDERERLRAFAVYYLDSECTTVECDRMARAALAETATATKEN